MPFRRGKTRPASLAASAARRVIGVRGVTTQVSSGPHAVREERWALVLVSYCPWKCVSSRYLHIDARTNHQSIYMEMLQWYPYVDATICSLHSVRLQAFKARPRQATHRRCLPGTL